MQRYFAKNINSQITLDESDIHHLLHVMRAKVGTNIEVVLDSVAYLAKVDSINPLIISKISEIKEKKELDVNVTLFFALAKGDKIDLVIQKATELGVKKIVLIKTKRDVVKFEQNDFDRKVARFNSIAKEASEQCHRLVIPEIVGVVDIKNIPNNLLCSINYVAYENVASYKPDFSDIKKLKNGESISILIGSEGGLEENEIDRLVNQGFIQVSLGNRILRTETAAIGALAVISYMIEGA